MLAISSFILSCVCWVKAQGISPQQLAASYGLSATTAFSMPPSPLGNSDAANFVLDADTWNVKRITDGASNLFFVADPYPNASPNVQNPQASPSANSSTVLAVNYPQGSFSHETGGVQFNTIFDPTKQGGYQTMLLSYEIAFQEGFQFARGGKIPGLRGGPFNAGCSGGAQPNGTDCFSVRLMWRPIGSGEVYAYIPTPNGLCDQDGVRCNTEGYGVSINRATFRFDPAKWTRITMLVRLNDPVYANGELQVYYNDLLAAKMQNLYYRSDDTINSVQGMYFSTFFGGSDQSWASPDSQYTYYRNIQLWASPSPSNITGAQPVKSFSAATSLRPGLSIWPFALSLCLVPLLFV